MQVQRHAKTRRASRTCGIVLIAAGLLILVLVAAVLLSPALPTILLRIIGFEAIRQRDAPVTAEAIATLANAADASPVSFVTQDFGRLALPPGIDLEVRVGDDALGDRVLQIVLRDSDLLNLCLQFTRFCGDRGSPIRRAQVSAAGGLVTISGEAFLDLINVWQAIEIHVRTDREDILKVDSVTLGGIRYELPANALGKRIRQIEATIAQVAKQLQVETSSGIFSFAGFDLSDNRLVANFR